MPERIYLDHAATTPMRPEAKAAVAEGMARWANPSSPHAEGRAARAALEEARGRIAAALDWSGHVIFTSGATEAAALGFARCRRIGPKPAVSTVEHDAVRRQAAGEDRFDLPVDAGGEVDPAALAAWLRLAPGGLVAIQHGNSETGVLQPVAQIGEAIDAAGSYLLVDCAQTAGKLPLPRADLLMVSAHKFGGPPGVGALLVADLKLLEPRGGQEFGYRPGTENLPAVLGFAAALDARPVRRDSEALARQLDNRHRLERRLAAHGVTAICADSVRSPYVASYPMPGMSAAAQLIRFDAAGISISAGSACGSGTLKPSHVLAALGVAPDVARTVIRVSFGDATTPDEVDAFADRWEAIAAGARGQAA